MYGSIYGHSVCGCAYLRNDSWPVVEYLPQVDLNVHSTILSSTSRTTLTQTFINPSKHEAIEEVSYMFPMYDGVSVVAFSCHVGDRVLHGLVKEKQQASAEYNEAVESGQTAGLLEQMTDASDVFRTKLGNIPADSKVVVAITYVGELRQDGQANGVRFTIPSVIAPRYGNVQDDEGAPSSTWTGLVQRGGLTITVDVIMEKGSVIRGLQSTSHPLAINLGRTSRSQDFDFQPHKASATLSLRRGQVLLGRDFVMVVNAECQNQPVAFLETHPSIPNQRALMTSLVPKFGLPDNTPEIVFVIDRSGSMASNIPTLQSALRVFLKSLPVGVMFNICSFGSSYSFMWQRSKDLDAACLEAALRYVNTIASDMGGTKMYQAVDATLKNRFKDKELEVLLLTDGETWEQDSLFSLINEASKGNTVRFFSLGIGSGASSSLVEGIARAGNGFSQFVLEDEELDRKVIRMLKGALTPHIYDFSLEVEYAAEDNDDDFEMVDAANTIPMVEPAASAGEHAEGFKAVEKPTEPISLFDNSYQESELRMNNGKIPVTDRFKNLPTIAVPKVLQAPTKVPSLFPFIRSNIYIIFSPETAGKTPKNLIFRGTSKYGPLSLRIPIQDAEIGETIHQLAAKKAVLELEEGRGWLLNAKTADGNSVKDTCDSKWENIVARECVRLGTKFQIAGRWCSFVALQNDNSMNAPELQCQVSSTKPADVSTAFGTRGGVSGRFLHGSRGGGHHQCKFQLSYNSAYVQYTMSDFTDPMCKTDQAMMCMASAPSQNFSSRGTYVHATGRARAVFCSTEAPIDGKSPIAGSRTSGASLFGSPSTQGPSPFSGSSASHINPGASPFGSPSSSGGLFGSAIQSPSPRVSSVFGSSSQPLSRPPETRPPSSRSVPLFGSLNMSQSPFGSSSTPNRTNSLFSVGRPPFPTGTSFDSTPRSSSPSHDKQTDISLTGNTDFCKEDAVPAITRSPPSFGGDVRQCDVSPPAPAAPRAMDKVHQIIGLQAFEGAWDWSSELLRVLGINHANVEPKLEEELNAAFEKYGVANDEDPFVDTTTSRLLATLLVRTFLEEKASDRKEIWELVDKKAENWIEKTLQSMGPDAAPFRDLKDVISCLL
ncbi:von Willebrand domain-containing protein [Paecilomyces variotii No. 5]|uniref:von Willebrand domain-containing protein n=1 Tax=Byssochlamys spectabilis (strain No. 5 / NBRC 109023) TaxID=1356009 RepID=V5FCF6_BYSSN|nr:von Willebrand domain-containing protein [Paecilomyces variotii No. 5]